MVAPLFPVPPEVFQSPLEYRDFHAGETLAPAPGITVRTAQLNHPNGATGYHEVRIKLKEPSGAESQS